LNLSASTTDEDRIMQIVLASNNAHKLDEIRAILPFDLLPQGELNIPSVEETGLTFIENAILKARHACRASGLPAIADDSGLEVSALDGQPGIYSSRFAGVHASDTENNQKLLAALAGQANRNARFQCFIVYLRHALDPVPIIGQGTWHGEISTTPSGVSGFGYDPLFYVPVLQKTAAELAPAEKNAISHRALALQHFASQFEAM
jgi:XTP/dITP diphosphohydrolase